MPLRPVDRELLSDVCRGIAEENYGFLYVHREKDRIRSEYESGEKSLTRRGTVSTSAIEEALQDVANDETYQFERIRGGVYYLDPFGTSDDFGITSELEGLFRNRMVVTTEELRERFDLSLDDADFFVRQLTRRDLVMRIAAGNRDYYTVGTKLKDEFGNPGLDEKLKGRSRYGKISHDDLESAISVSATTDVINYLETEGYVVDLDGEYLVRSGLDEFGTHLSETVADAVAEEFEDSGYVMPLDEYRQVLRNSIEARSDVLTTARSVRSDVLTESEVLDPVEASLADRGFEVDEDAGVAVHREPFEEQVDAHSEELAAPVLASDVAASPSSMMEEVEPDIAELQLAATEAANEYVRDRVRERTRERIEEAF